MGIEAGLVGEKRRVVLETDTAAAAAGPELPPVFSTPRVIGLMESAAHAAVVDQLHDGQTTVGVQVNIRHMAATPVGMEVWARAELLEAEGRRLRFKVEAWDQMEKIAEGEHERFIIDVSRFIARVEEKQKSLQSG